MANLNHVFGSHSDLCINCGIGSGFFGGNITKPCPSSIKKAVELLTSIDNSSESAWNRWLFERDFLLKGVIL